MNNTLGTATYGEGFGELYVGLVEGFYGRKKRVLYKVYDNAGNYITTWNDVVSEFQITKEVNAGLGEVTVKLARTFKNFGEGQDVKLGNRLEIIVFDPQTGYEGQKEFSGQITRYVPDDNQVEVTCISWWWLASQIILEGAGATTVTYTSQDAGNIIKDILDKFSAQGGTLTYTPTSIGLTGELITYSFNTATVQEALQKVVTLAPSNWYLRIDADNVVWFQERSTEADHILTLGKDIIDYKLEKRIENIVNRVYFMGGGDPVFYKKYENTGSQLLYGIRATRFSDNRVTTDTVASKVATRIFDNQAEQETRVTIKVLDNNGSAYIRKKGYDIDKIQVGETVRITNSTSGTDVLWDGATFDVSVWDYAIADSASLVLQIQRIQKTRKYAILELSNKQPNFIARVEEINKRMLDTITTNNPTTPS